MTLDQLRVFVAVAESLNMRATGDRLHLTQSAVSATIAALETRHATRLFDRVGRGLALTAAGRDFLPEARAVLARADEARRVLEDLAGLARGEIRLAASQTLATYWLPPRLAAFVAAHPGVDVALSVGNSRQAVRAVLNGEADLGFIEGDLDSSDRTDRLVVQTVGGDRISLHARPGHPLSGRTLRPDDLRAAAWASREPGSGTRARVEAGLLALGVDPGRLDLRLVLASNEAVLEAVGAADLIAGVSDLASASRVATGQLVRLDCALPARDFRLLQHRERRAGSAVTAFLGGLDLDPGLGQGRGLDPGMARDHTETLAPARGPAAAVSGSGTRPAASRRS